MPRLLTLSHGDPEIPSGAHATVSSVRLHDGSAADLVRVIRDAEPERVHQLRTAADVPSPIRAMLVAQAVRDLLAGRPPASPLDSGDWAEATPWMVAP